MASKEWFQLLLRHPGLDWVRVDIFQTMPFIKIYIEDMQVQVFTASTEVEALEALYSAYEGIQSMPPLTEDEYADVNAVLTATEEKFPPD